MGFKDKIKVLVIEDNKTVHYAVNKLLSDSSIWIFDIDSALNMTDALIKKKKNSYNIVLSDLELPDSNRKSTLKIIKNEFNHLPVIILSATDDDELLLQSIEAGAQDYICKDFIQSGALLSRSLYNAIEHWNVKTRLKYIASHDDLTSAVNKRYFMMDLESIIDSSIYTDDPFCLAICDLDNFRNINNSYGHIIGDKALKVFANIISENISQSDILARFGGDEFCILLKGIAKEECQQLLTKLSKLDIILPLNDYPQNIIIKSSYGGAQYKKGMTAEGLLIQADTALYQVKEQGKGFSKVL